MASQPDMFDGFFDDRKTGVRGLWRDGELTRHAHKAVICPTNPWKELRAPWGYYPDLPRNAASPPEPLE